MSNKLSEIIEHLPMQGCFRFTADILIILLLTLYHISRGFTLQHEKLNIVCRQSSFFFTKQ